MLKSLPFVLGTYKSSVVWIQVNEFLFLTLELGNFYEVVLILVTPDCKISWYIMVVVLVIPDCKTSWYIMMLVFKSLHCDEKLSD